MLGNLFLQLAFYQITILPKIAKTSYTALKLFVASQAITTCSLKTQCMMKRKSKFYQFITHLNFLYTKYLTYRLLLIFLNLNIQFFIMFLYASLKFIVSTGMLINFMSNESFPWYWTVCKKHNHIYQAKQKTQFKQ